MYRGNKEIRIELSAPNGNDDKSVLNITNPIYNKSNETDKIKAMVTNILDKELAMLKNNTLLHGLVLQSVIEKVKTVQTVENVLSYIKEKNVKEIEDVQFKNGEVYIKCSM